MNDRELEELRKGLAVCKQYGLAVNYDDIEQLISTVEGLNADVKLLKDDRSKLADFIKDMIRDGCWNIDGGDLQDKAERNGFIVAEEYDPEKHGDYFDGEPGDTIYVFSGLLKGE